MTSPPPPPPRSRPLPLHRKLLYSAVVLGLFLLMAEGLLSLYPVLFQSRRADTPVLRGVGSGEGRFGGMVVAVGDSVTAGVGVSPGKAWPDYLRVSLSRDQVPLQRVASPGAGLDFATGDPLALVQGLPMESAPMVLLMLGHNDVLRWAPGARQGFERLRRSAAAGGGEAARWQGPRLLRAARWLWLATVRAPPTVAVPDDLVPRMVAAWQPLQHAAHERGGALLLMTYLVPPPPPLGLDGDLAAVITASRGAQQAVNTAIRRAAAGLGREGVGVLDLEQSVPVGEEWALDVFVDHIHLSTESHARVAAAVYAALRPPPSEAGGDQRGGEEGL